MKKIHFFMYALLCSLCLVNIDVAAGQNKEHQDPSTRPSSVDIFNNNQEKVACETTPVKDHGTTPVTPPKKDQNNVEHGTTPPTEHGTTPLPLVASLSQLQFSSNTSLDHLPNGRSNSTIFDDLVVNNLRPLTKNLPEVVTVMLTVNSPMKTR